MKPGPAISQRSTGSSPKSKHSSRAAAIFWGAHLIAGMFSFFNAGSGSNQSNHLFKSGANEVEVALDGAGAAEA